MGCKSLAVGAVVAGLALILPAVASANCVTNNNPNRTANSLNYAASWRNQNPTGNYDFVDANILVKSPNLAPNCLANHCWSYGWIMMTSSTLLRWAQYGAFEGDYQNSSIGPGADYAQCVAENSSGTITDFYESWNSSSVPGTAPHYRIHFGLDPDNQSSNKIFVKDGQIYDWCGGDNGNDPFTFTPVEAQAGSEIRDQQTQLPGSVATHENFASATVTDPNVGSSAFFARGFWDYLSTGNKSWMKKQVDSSDKHNADMWDGDCP